MDDLNNYLAAIDQDKRASAQKPSAAAEVSAGLNAANQSSFMGMLWLLNASEQEPGDCYQGIVPRRIVTR
jgi:hypothetical protein